MRGCDVWINLPRPPLEASGTSGMKNVVNGGLQLTVLDGWWAEGYDGGNGWALSGDVDHDHGAQDARHAHELFRLLEEEVAPEFYRASADGIPRDWVARIRRSLRTLGPEFGAGRMLEDYEKKVYKTGRYGLISSRGVSVGVASAEGVLVGVGVGVGVVDPSPSTVGDGVASGSGTASRSGCRRLMRRPVPRVELLLHVRPEAVQARVEVLVDLCDALVDAVLDDPARDEQDRGDADQHDERRRHQHPRRHAAALTEAATAVGAPGTGRPRDARALRTYALRRRAG